MLEAPLVSTAAPQKAVVEATFLASLRVNKGQ